MLSSCDDSIDIRVFVGGTQGCQPLTYAWDISLTGLVQLDNLVEVASSCRTKLGLHIKSLLFHVVLENVNTMSGDEGALLQALRDRLANVNSPRLVIERSQVVIPFNVIRLSNGHSNKLFVCFCSDSIWIRVHAQRSGQQLFIAVSRSHSRV